MNILWQYIVNRLKEPSTWRGLTILLTLAGVNVSPEQTTAIIAFGAAIVAFIGVFFPDKTVVK